MLAVPVGGLGQQLLPARLSHQVVLGQRRSLIRQVLLVADQDDLAVEALVPQRLRRVRAGEARPNDHVGVVLGHEPLLSAPLGQRYPTSMVLPTPPAPRLPSTIAPPHPRRTRGYFAVAHTTVKCPRCFGKGWRRVRS